MGQPSSFSLWEVVLAVQGLVWIAIQGYSSGYRTIYQYTLYKKYSCSKGLLHDCAAELLRYEMLIHK